MPALPMSGIWVGGGWTGKFWEFVLIRGSFYENLFPFHRKRRRSIRISRMLLKSAPPIVPETR
jgi:hypothetical protein